MPRLTRRRATASRARDEAAEGFSLLSALDAEYGDILAVLDETAAYRKIVEQLREPVGLDLAWVGVPTGDAKIVLRSVVGARAGSLNGLVVNAGQGLGGKVLASRQLHGVRDYVSARSISHQFDKQVREEELRGMIAVPMMVGNRMFGVLYGGNRKPARFSDRTIAAVLDAGTRGARAALVAERARHLAEVAVHEERRRLAVELHDTVGALLFNITVQARGLGDRSGLDPDLRQRLAAIEERSGEAATKLRESLRVLHASPQEVALGVALRADSRSFEERTGVPVRVLIAELPDLHPSRVKALIESLREALLNVEKHARASSVVVAVCGGEGGVCTSVVDDGVGVPTARMQPGLGLQAVADRLERVGGRLSLTRNDEGGVTFRAWVPT
jgi:signal transduction histidine kinase